MTEVIQVGAEQFLPHLGREVWAILDRICNSTEKISHPDMAAEGLLQNRYRQGECPGDVGEDLHTKIT